MGVPVTLPFIFTNGPSNIIDAPQVMANYGAITTALANQVAESGANGSITALTGLTTPISPSLGGTNVFVASAASTGTANAQVVAATIPTGFTNSINATIIFPAGITNTLPAVTLQVASTPAASIVKRSLTGVVALSPGDITAGNLVTATFDGSHYQLVNDLPYFGFPTNFAAGATTDLGLCPSHVVQITGSNNISSFGSTASESFPAYYLRFNGPGSLSIAASSNMFLPGGVNIQAFPGDCCVAIYFGSGTWAITNFTRNVIPYRAAAPFATTLTAVTGAGTYNTPGDSAGQLPIYLWVRMVGSGGGGGSSLTNGGTNGGGISFDGWSAGGGAGGTGGNTAGSSAGGIGGTGGANGTGQLITRVDGQRGNSGASWPSGGPSAFMIGGSGGNSFFGGAGVAFLAGGGGAGTAAAANSGSGGGGGSSPLGVPVASGAGGGAGEFVEFIIPSPAASYPYVINAGGTGGTAGSGGIVGGAGAIGRIDVIAYYQ